MITFYGHKKAIPRTLPKEGTFNVGATPPWRRLAILMTPKGGTKTSKENKPTSNQTSNGPIRPYLSVIPEGGTAPTIRMTMIKFHVHMRLGFI